MNEQDNTPKALRKYCQQLGITPATTGQSIDELILQARKADDPRAWLAALSDAPPEEESTSRDPGKPRLNPADLVEPASVPTRETIAKDILNPAAKPKPATTLTPSPRIKPGVTMSPPPPPPRPVAVRSITLALPISSEDPVGYIEREMHLDVRLDPAASRAFRRIWNALDAQNVRVKSGRHVGKSRADVVRWVFEKLAEVIEAEEKSHA
jgi:hypothetical protein